MAVQSGRVGKHVKNKGLISGLEGKVLDLTDTALRLQEDIQKWKEWQAHYCFVFQSVHQRTLEKLPFSYSFAEKRLWAACEESLKDILYRNRELGITPKRVSVNFQEYLAWEQQHVFNLKFYEGTAWLPYKIWIDEWERLTEIVVELEEHQRYYDSLGSSTVDSYVQLWSEIKMERTRLGRVAIQIIRNSKFAFLEDLPGSPGLIPSPASLWSADFNMSPPLRTVRPDAEPLLDRQESSLLQELLSKGNLSFSKDSNGHVRFLVTMDNIFSKHIRYAHDWLMKLGGLVHRSDEQIGRLQRAYHELPPWKQESQDSLDALNTYATSFQDDYEHEIHMKARIAARRQRTQIARIEALQERYANWHGKLVEKRDGYDLDGLEGRNIIERNGVIRVIMKHRVQQILATRPKHSEARYDAVIIDTVTLVAKRNNLDLGLERHITSTETKYGEDQALILRQQRREYTEWRETTFKDFYEKTRSDPTQRGKARPGSKVLFSAMSSHDSDRNLQDIYEFNNVLKYDYIRFKELCIEAGFWTEAKEQATEPPLSSEGTLQGSQVSTRPINPEIELAEYPEGGERIRAFLTSPDIAPEFDSEFFRNDVETFINRCSNFLATPFTATEREKWYNFLVYCTRAKDLFKVDGSNMVRRIEAGWGFYWRNPVAGPPRKCYDVRKPSSFEPFRRWVIASRWQLDLGDEEVFRRDMPRQVLYQHYFASNLATNFPSAFEEFRNLIKYCHGTRQLFLMTPGNNLRRIGVGWPVELQRPENYDNWFKVVLMGARTMMQVVVGTKTTPSQLYREFQKAETHPRIKLGTVEYKMGGDEFLENLTFAVDRCEMFKRFSTDEGNLESNSRGNIGDNFLIIIDRGWVRDGWDGNRIGGIYGMLPGTQ